jgi:hypothetical protein
MCPNLVVGSLRALPPHRLGLVEQQQDARRLAVIAVGVEDPLEHLGRRRADRPAAVVEAGLGRIEPR